MIRTVIFVAIHFLWTGFLGIVVLLISLFDFRGRMIGMLVRLWSIGLLKASGLRYRVQGLAKLDRRSHYFFAANHESAFDIPVAFAGLPFHVVSMAKKELKRIPIMGWAMVGAKHIFVDRRHPKRAVKDLQKAAESLKKNPRSVLIFPEGTRSTDGKIHPFKKGGLGIAIDLGMSVVPVAICGTAEVTPRKSLRLRPGTVELRIGSPIDTTAWKERKKDEFAVWVREQVVALKERWQAERGKKVLRTAA